MKNAFGFENTQSKQIYNTHSSAVKKRFRFAKDTIKNTVGEKEKRLIVQGRWVYMFFTVAPFEQEPHCMQIYSGNGIK